MPVVRGRIRKIVIKTSRKNYTYPIISLPNLDKEIKKLFEEDTDVIVSVHQVKKGYTE
jgi:hypothetical protein